MFLLNPNTVTAGKVSLIGEFVRMDGQNVILKSNGHNFVIKPKKLEGYKTKLILVVGKVEDGIIHEEYTQSVDDSFDMNLYLRLAKVSSKFPELF